MFENGESYWNVSSKDQLPSSVASEKQSHQLSHMALVQGVPVLNNKILTLYVLLHVQEGRNLVICNFNKILNTDPDKPTPNCYLVSKMFWDTDAVTSQVCWASTTPFWDFSEVVPMQLSTALIERLRGNYIVLEVWHKQINTSDQLIGLIKLPLHQLFLSYRDPAVTQALLRAQFPVIVCDNIWLPVKCPFYGKECGELRVTFAMGSADQITAVQLSRKPDKRFNYDSTSWDKIHSSLSQDNAVNESKTTFAEHIFMIKLDGLRELQLPEAGVIWGEADFFVQYCFPSMSTISLGDNLRTYRSPTTMATTHPKLHHLTHHRFSLPEDIPLQQRLAVCAASSNGFASDLPVTLWLRHYLPNVHEICIAKGTLSLSKLCALVSLHKVNILFLCTLAFTISGTFVFRN